VLRKPREFRHAVANSKQVEDAVDVTDVACIELNKSGFELLSEGETL
jgi:hypothetical protein